MYQQASFSACLISKHLTKQTAIMELSQNKLGIDLAKFLWQKASSVDAIWFPLNRNPYQFVATHCFYGDSCGID